MIMTGKKTLRWIQQRFRLLPIVTALLVMLVLFGTEKPLPDPSLEHTWFLPELRLNTSALDKIVLWSARGRLVLEKQGNQWIVPQLGGYPADLRRVVDFILPLREMRILARKTARPQDLSVLGLDEQQGTHIMLMAGDRVVGNFVNGRASVHGQGGFVRHNGQSQAWLVNKQVIASISPLSWVDNTLLEIDPGQFDHLQVYVDNQLVGTWPREARPGADHAPYDGKAPVADLLHPLSFFGVRARPAGPLQARLATRVYTRDGLVYQLDHYWYDQRWWTAVQVSPAIERSSSGSSDNQWLRQIQRANTHWQSWWYQLSDEALSALTLGRSTGIIPPAAWQ